MNKAFVASYVKDSILKAIVQGECRLHGDIEVGGRLLRNSTIDIIRLGRAAEFCRAKSWPSSCQ